MKQLLLGMLLLCCAANPAMAVKEVESHPLIKPYPGSTVWESKVGKFDRIALPAGKFARQGPRTVFARTVKVEGKITGITYRTPPERTALEILSNYQDGLKQGGFEVLFSCLESECGGGTFETPYLRNRFYAGYNKTGMLSAKLARADGDVYVFISVDQGNANSGLLVVEARPMDTGLVKVDADALLNDIERTGHASIYGIYFDTNKADVKPESKQALGEIAKLLKNKPDLKLYVVGHTDNVGELTYNKKLSMSRSAAVVGVLTKDYGINPQRLQADGVGPLAPVLANTSDAGRAKNRRVELVAR